jgi:rhodanese-related sulfurtransferase
MKLLSLRPRVQHGNEIREIAPHQLARMKPHPLIIDIREEREYRLGHIEGAVHVSRNTLESRVFEIAPELDTPIVIYCAVGSACVSAAEALRRLGYQKIFSLKGGLQSWLEAGGLVESSQSGVKLREFTPRGGL